MAALGVNTPLGNLVIGTLKSLIDKPIGMLSRNRKMLYSHLSRNAGGMFDYGYDSWGTPIGMPAEVDYTERNGRPQYLTDRYRDEYPNYVEYVKQIYGSSFSVTNINALDTFIMKPDSDNTVGVMDMNDDDVKRAIDNPVKDIYTPINPNHTSVDTILGEESSWHLGETMATSRLFNSERTSDRIRSISSIVPYTFGMNNGAYGNNAEGFRFFTDEDGRNDSIFESLTMNAVSDDGTITTVGSRGPIYTHKTSDNLSYFIEDGSPYDEYIKSLSLYENSFRENNLNLRSALDIDGGNIVRGSRQKYYTPDREGTYVYKVFGRDGNISKDTEIDEISVRYVFESNRKTIQSSTSTGNMGAVTTLVYAEKDGNKSANSISNASVGTFSRFSRYQSFDSNTETEDLIDYTNKAFRKGKIDTLIARFHGNENIDKTDPTATAWSSHGYSHGRNLLKRNHNSQGDNDVNGYDNPYCRVWTYHHQYHRLADAIRPMAEDGHIMTPSDLDANNGWGKFRSPDTGMDGGSGSGRLTKYGVINYKVNGLVNITPANDGDSTRKVDIKSCMFSIENLAWKDAFSVTGGSDKTSQNLGLSKEQKGPFGGRIMWFPPYDLSFDEQVHANWNSNDFIGRGESIYTYSNTTRSGNLKFKLLIDHPSAINYWRGRKETDTSGGVDDVESNEQSLLRFFAGCEKLNIAPDPVPEPEPEPEPVIPEPQPEVDTITVFLFFPNNYSGESDGYEKAIKYLVNGMGAGKIKSNGKTVDYNITMEKCKDSSGKIVGGYEMRGGCPISLVNTPLSQSKGGFITNAYQGNKLVPLMSMNGNDTNAWWKRKWAYRVDKDTMFINEVLHKPIYYVDTESYCLNSGGNREKILRTFNNVKSKNLFAFTDLFIALGSDEDKRTLATCYNQDNVNLIKELINKYGIKEVKCYGWASSHGTSSKNSQLATRRAKTVKMWLEKKLGSKLKKITYKKSGVGRVSDNSDVSSLNAKIYRCAQIDIKLQLSTVDNVQNTQKGNDTLTIKKNEKNTATKLVDKAKKVYNKVTNKNAKTGNDTTKNETLQRYDNEGDFFRLLELNDPVTHHKITDKIKFFDPAFHSVSPEGFNARLTFLQQCMRQGPTVGGSDVNRANANTANNLAFGRAPVCILRIGDFYYSKIIIETLNITYDRPWDLNTEGIGVMPMIADVTLGFKFIGGSSLTGPIDRLQNALSFNMYANTEVYDNRAEQVDYDEEGKIIKYKAFEPQ